ncbi:MAG: tetratricopeptide repeat protein, partial [Candidatus Latescibacterota bacterium]
LIAAANIHIQAGQPDRGRALLNQLLEGVQGDPQLEAQAHFQMAQLDLNNQNYVDALARYNKVVEEYPQSEVITEARYGRALAYHHTGRYTSALADYQWLLDHDPPQALRTKVLFSMALSYSANGEDSRARGLLNQVIASGEESLVRNARLQLIAMAEKQDPREAVGIYEEMLRTITSAEDKENVLIRLASAYFRMDQYQQSIDAAGRLLEVAGDAESVANALFVQGNSYFRAGDYPRAIAAYQKIVDEYPQIGWAQNALFQIGVSYSKVGGTEVLPEVSKAFFAYYTKYPDDAERAPAAYYYDAWARYRLGRWAEASGVFAALAARHADTRYAPEALFRAGEALYNLTKRGAVDREQHLMEAMAFYDRVMARYPGGDYADDALYNKAWCLIDLQRPEEAVPLFQRIVAEHPNGRYGPRSQFTLGDYYYGLKDYARATENYQRFLDLYPAGKLQSGQFDAMDRGLPQKASVYLSNLAEIDAYNLYAQGEKLFDGKQYDQAVAIFREVQEKYPQSDQAVNATVNIGAAYMAQEDFRQAGGIFQQIVEKYADNPKFAAQVDFARQQLEALQEARVL